MLYEATYSNVDEYVVPVGYSLDSWIAKKNKDNVSNKQYADDTKGDRWKVVHGKTRPKRKSKKGRSLKKTKRGMPINDKAKDLSYSKATRIHNAIKLGEAYEAMLEKFINSLER